MCSPTAPLPSLPTVACSLIPIYYCNIFQNILENVEVIQGEGVPKEPPKCAFPLPPSSLPTVSHCPLQALLLRALLLRAC